MRARGHARTRHAPARRGKVKRGSFCAAPPLPSSRVGCKIIKHYTNNNFYDRYESRAPPRCCESRTYFSLHFEGGERSLRSKPNKSKKGFLTPTDLALRMFPSGSKMARAPATSSSSGSSSRMSTAVSCLIQTFAELLHGWAVASVEAFQTFPS